MDSPLSVRVNADVLLVLSVQAQAKQPWAELLALLAATAESLLRKLYSGGELWIVVPRLDDCCITARAGATAFAHADDDLVRSERVDLDVRNNTF